MAALEQFNKQRGGLRAAITVSVKQIPDSIRGGIVNDMLALGERISGFLKKVESVDNEIAQLLTEQSALAAHYIESGTYVSDIRREVLALEEAVIGLRNAQQPVKSETVKLPRLNLPKFSGDNTEWNSFWDLFDVGVNQKTELSDVEKLIYLKGQLSGGALKLIDGFKSEAQYYNEVVTLLKNTYGKKDEIKVAHVKRLLNLGCPSLSAEGLREFQADFECHIRSLNKLGLTLDELFTVLLYNKLPSEFGITVKRGAGDNWLDFKVFKEFFEQEIGNVNMSCKGDEGVKVGSEVGASSVSLFALQQSQSLCQLCNKPHPWFRCTTYEDKGDRHRRVKSLGLCFICCGKGHSRSQCNESRYLCSKCSDSHHYSICMAGQAGTSAVGSEKGESKGKGKAGQKGDEKKAKDKGLNKQKDKDVHLKILKVTEESTRVSVLPTATFALAENTDGLVKVRSLLDPCAERTFVKRDVLSKVKYQNRGTAPIRIHGYCSTIEEMEYDIVRLEIPRPKDNLYVDAVVVDRLPLYGKEFTMDYVKDKLKKRKINLADKDFFLPKQSQSPIEMLVGVDNVYKVLHPGFKRMNNLVLLPSIFGYILTGSVQAAQAEEDANVVSILKVATSEMGIHSISERENTVTSKTLESLWALDHIGITQTDSCEVDKLVLKHFESKISFSDSENQYVVELPWKEWPPKLPTNFGLAMGRLRNLVKKFEADEAYLKHYQEILDEQEKRGFIERVEEKHTEGAHYLAHHGVKRESKTTPIRIVFDCSAKGSESSYSLNDCLWTGPPLTSDLTQVLLRFRLNRFVCLSDIEKAFLMIQLREEDRNYTRFLWFENPLSADSKLVVYRFRVVLFGATCSPFLLNATILKHLSSLPEDTTQIRDGLYVDNLLYTCNDEQEMLRFFLYVSKVFAEAHLYLKEWTSNNGTLRAVVGGLNLGSLKVEETMVLGLRWDIVNDLIKFPERKFSDKVTKREILSSVSQIFDPLGLLLPVTIKGRMFLQELWAEKIDWDEQLSAVLVEKWSSLKQELLECMKVRVPRIVTIHRDVALHLFSDASKVAYGTAAYLVMGREVKLLMAKARVAPMTKTTIPRLELTALLLSARLSDFIRDSYKNQLKIKEIYLWSDSQVALSWTKSDRTTLPIYVRNRVDEIKTLMTLQTRLNYVPTGDNPADFLSRGVSASKFKDISLWWEGPEWLPEKDKWPKVDFNCNDRQDDVTVLVQEDIRQESWWNWDRFSKLSRHIGALAWVKRFVSNCKKTQAERNLDDFISVEEYEEATVKLLELLQKENFLKEYKYLKGDPKRKPKPNLVAQLDLIFDNNLIKCKGRLENADLEVEAKFPILLPKEGNLVKVIIREAHLRVGHMGLNATVAELRRRYWIPQIRQAVKSVIRSCVPCRRLQGKSYDSSQSPPLPPFRVNRCNPFEVTGVDYTGALLIKEHSNMVKVYVLLFTCPVTRGIHLEVVRDLTCNTFLLAFRRFINRKTFPSLMLSDNAKTFVAAADYLKEMFDSISVKDHMNATGCKWQFIPARAPWFGAIWERMIGIMKSCLKKIVGRALLNFDELTTILAEVECMVNNRPLTYVSGDLRECDALSPNHLLYGRKLRAYPSSTNPDFTSDPNFGEKQALVGRYKHISNVCDQLWVRWRQEYLTALRETHGRTKEGECWPTVGEIVLIHDEGPRTLWKLGRVSELYQGGDNRVRVVKLKISGGFLIRPVVKLYPLEILDRSESETPPQLETDSQQRVLPKRKAAQRAADKRRDLIKTGHL